MDYSHELVDAKQGWLRQLYKIDERDDKRIPADEVDHVKKKYIDGRVTIATQEKFSRTDIDKAAIELAALHNEMEDKAMRDWLTGAFSRNAILNYGEFVLSEGHKHSDRMVGVAMFDLDEFSEIAKPKSGESRVDTMKRGDLTIKNFFTEASIAVGNLIKEAEENEEWDLVRQYKTIRMGRNGGDEFVMIGSHLKEGVFETTLEAIRLRVEENLTLVSGVEKLKEKLTTSMGVVLIKSEKNDHAQPDIESVLSRADQLLFEAKKLGKNRLEVEERGANSFEVIEKSETKKPKSMRQDSLVLQYKALLNSYLEKGEVKEVMDIVTKGINKLERGATTDDLTGLLNRGAGEERLEMTLASETENAFPVTVAMVDIDRFKYINDVTDHKMGDAVLRIVSSKLGALFDEDGSDQGSGFVVRYHPGGQFMVVMDHVPADEANLKLIITVGNIRKALREIDGLAGKLEQAGKAAPSLTTVVLNISSHEAAELMNQKITAGLTTRERRSIEVLERFFSDVSQKVKGESGINTEEGEVVESRDCVLVVNSLGAKQATVSKWGQPNVWKVAIA